LTTAEHSEDIILTWHKASRSNAGNNCVEIAQTPDGYLIRDSKNPSGSRLPIDTTTWATLIDDVKTGKYRGLSRFQ
jgi:Domain of unknown function (DUF397)